MCTLFLIGLGLERVLNCAARMLTIFSAKPTAYDLYGQVKCTYIVLLVALLPFDNMGPEAYTTLLRPRVMNI